MAVASIWPGPLVLGLGGTQIVLLALTVVAGVLTVYPAGRHPSGLEFTSPSSPRSSSRPRARDRKAGLSERDRGDG